MHHQITRAFPDGVDEDYRIDGFEIAGVGYRSLDDTLAMYKLGHTFWSGSAFKPATVFRKVHPTTKREYLTTVPDGYRPNNLSTLARPAGPYSAVANALAGYPVGGLGRLIK